MTTDELTTGARLRLVTEWVWHRLTPLVDGMEVTAVRLHPREWRDPDEGPQRAPAHADVQVKHRADAERVAAALGLPLSRDWEPDEHTPTRQTWWEGPHGGVGVRVVALDPRPDEDEG